MSCLETPGSQRECGSAEGSLQDLPHSRLCGPGFSPRSGFSPVAPQGSGARPFLWAWRWVQEELLLPANQTFSSLYILYVEPFILLSRTLLLVKDNLLSC